MRNMTKLTEKNGPVGQTLTSVEVVKAENALRSIKLSFDGGGTIEIGMASYSLEVLVPAAPKMVERWKLHGMIDGMAVVERFYTSRTAGDRDMQNFADRYGNTALTLESVMLPEDDVDAVPFDEPMPF